MPLRSGLIILLALILGACSFPRHPLDIRPTHEARALSDAERALIEQGIELHDAGDFAGARARYTAVLETNPASAVARYQIALSYVHEGDDELCFRNAATGARLRSETRAELLHLAGVCLDNMNRPEDALPMLVQAAALRPDLYQFHFSRALVEDRLGYSHHALESLRRALEANPYHASSHLQFAFISHSLGQRFAAFLAYSFFLLIEEDSPHVADAQDAFLELLSMTGREENGQRVIDLEINIFDETSERQNQAELMFALMGVHRALPENADMSERELIVSFYNRMFGLTSELLVDDDGQEDIVWSFYAPFFADLHSAGHTETLVHFVLAGMGWEGVHDWLDSNGDAVESLVAWFENR